MDISSKLFKSKFSHNNFSFNFDFGLFDYLFPSCFDFSNNLSDLVHLILMRHDSSSR